MTPCVSSGLTHGGGEGTLLLGKALLSWTAYLVCSVSAVVIQMLSDSWKTCVEDARSDCSACLTPLILEAMCCGHSGLHRSQGKTE